MRYCVLLSVLLTQAVAAGECDLLREAWTARDDLRDLADAMEFSVGQHPDWLAMFRINGQLLSEALRGLANQLDHNIVTCSCRGPCVDVSFEEHCRAS